MSPEPMAATCGGRYKGCPVLGRLGAPYRLTSRGAGPPWRIFGWSVGSKPSVRSSVTHRIIMLCALILCVALVLPGSSPATPAAEMASSGSIATNSAAPAEQVAVPSAQPDDGRGTPYKLDKDDAICGLSEARQLTSPAKVDFKALMAATAEMKELRRKKIDPNSARGIELTCKARELVRDACSLVRTENSHCSIWKKISRRDKQAVPDVTSAVKDKLTAGGLL